MDENTRRDLTQGTTHRSSGSFELVLGAVIFSMIGLAIDGMAGLTPLFTIVFAVAGFAGATVSLFYRYAGDMRRHGGHRGA